MKIERNLHMITDNSKEFVIFMTERVFCVFKTLIYLVPRIIFIRKSTRFTSIEVNWFIFIECVVFGGHFGQNRKISWLLLLHCAFFNFRRIHMKCSNKTSFHKTFVCHPVTSGSCRCSCCIRNLWKVTQN